MSSREFIAQVSGAGLLPGKTSREIADLIRSMPGKRVRIRVGLYRKKRSSHQNAYYWGVVVPLVTGMFRDAGNYCDEEDVHAFLKLRVGKLSQVIVTPDGEVVKTLGSTARLTTTEFSAYVEMIRAWAAEFGLSIPLPWESVS